MRPRHLIALVACSLLLVSCGGKKEEPPPSAPAEGAEQPAGKKGKKKGKAAPAEDAALPAGPAATAVVVPPTPRPPLGSVLVASPCPAKCLADKYLAAAPTVTLPDSPRFAVGLVLSVGGAEAPAIAKGVVFLASRPSAEGMLAEYGALQPETAKQREQHEVLAHNIEAFVAGTTPGVIVPTDVYHHLEASPRRARTPVVQEATGLLVGGRPPAHVRRVDDFWMVAEMGADGQVAKLAVLTDRVLSMPTK